MTLGNICKHVENSDEVRVRVRILLLPTHSDYESRASLSHKGGLPLRPGKGIIFPTQSFQICSVCGFKLYFRASEALVSKLSSIELSAQNTLYGHLSVLLDSNHLDDD